MSKCPKCGTKLRLIDIDQCCPKCGVNMRLYGFEEEFYKEAKTAELSQAGYSCKIRRLKMAFIGTPLTKARLAVMILPLVSLLIPAGNAVISLPFKEAAVPISALGLYNAFSGGEFDLIMSFASGGSEATAFAALRLTVILLAAAALFAVAALLCSLLCFASIQKMQKVICGVSAAGAVASLATLVSVFLLKNKTAGGAILTTSPGFGLFVAVAMFAVVFVVNLLIDKKGIPVEYPEGAVERSEIWKKVKAGEIDIDSLPYPIVETAETAKIKEEIAAQREAFINAQNEEEEVAMHEEEA